MERLNAILKELGQKDSDELERYLEHLIYQTVKHTFEDDRQFFDNHSQVLEEFYKIKRLHFGKKVDEDSFLLGKLETLLQIVKGIQVEKLPDEFLQSLNELNINFGILETIYTLGKVDIDYLHFKLKQPISSLKEDLHALLEFDLIYKEDTNIIDRYLCTKKAKVLFEHYLPLQTKQELLNFFQITYSGITLGLPREQLKMQLKRSCKCYLVDYLFEDTFSRLQNELAKAKKHYLDYQETWGRNCVIFIGEITYDNPRLFNNQINLDENLSDPLKFDLSKNQPEPLSNLSFSKNEVTS